MAFSSISPSSVAVLGVLAVLCAGCSTTPRPLMPTPAIYQGVGAERLFDDLPESRRVPSIDLLYVTDREPESDDALPYGEHRARSMAYGSVIVDMGPDLTWEVVDQQSHLEVRTTDVNLVLGKVTELGRFPGEPYPLMRTSRGTVPTPAVLEQHREARAGFEAELQRRLEAAASKEVIVYVHGFNETFATAAFTMAELCHFLGREHVCMIFTWPAASSGSFLTAYTTTTESADYAVNHLKKTIRMMARTRGVAGLQLLAHSRGSALMLNAVRELMIETVAAGEVPADLLKIDNVVLMSPDLDTEVTGQKLTTFSSDPDRIGGRVGDPVPVALRGRLTIYSSPSDRALLASTILFRSRLRLGRLRSEDIGSATEEFFATIDKLDLVIYDGEHTDSYGHAYFVTNPMVSSDLIEIVRYNRRLGEEGRRLEQVGPITWLFPFYDASSTRPRPTSRLRRERRARPADSYRSFTYGTGR